MIPATALEMSWYPQRSSLSGSGYIDVEPLLARGLDIACEPHPENRSRRTSATLRIPECLHDRRGPDQRPWNQASQGNRPGPGTCSSSEARFSTHISVFRSLTRQTVIRSPASWGISLWSPKKDDEEDSASRKRIPFLLPQGSALKSAPGPSNGEG